MNTDEECRWQLPPGTHLMHFTAALNAQEAFIIASYRT